MLDDICLFINLYELKSFKQCALANNMQTSTLSKHIIALEQKLGKQLIIRTTKAFTITQFGEDIYNKFKHLPNLAPNVLETTNKQLESSTQSGTLKISLGDSISYELVTPMLEEFMIKNPNITLEVYFIQNLHKWTPKGTNLVLSAQKIEHPNLNNRFLRSEYIKLYCRPEYVLKYGMPMTPNELEQHHIIGGMSVDDITPLKDIILYNHKTKKTFQLNLNKCKIKVNSPIHMRKIALQHNYIVGGFDSLYIKDLEEGRIMPVLPEWHGHKIDFYIISKKNTSIIENAFIEFIYHCMSKAYTKMVLEKNNDISKKIW